MTDEECNVVYDTLVDILNKNGMEWVITQVNEQLRLGRTVEKEIKTLTESRSREAFFPFEEYKRNLRSGPTATFPVTVEYQPKERLVLLIDAIEQAVVNTAEMESQSITLLAGELPSFNSIEFYSDDNDQSPVVVDRQSAALRRTQGEKLKHLLDELRRDI